jgi:DNA-binding LytR/AlgR family response regulator
MNNVPVGGRVPAAGLQQLPLLRLPIGALFIPSDPDGVEMPGRLDDRLARGYLHIHLLATPDLMPNPTPASPWVQDFWVPHRGETIRIATKEIDLISAERDYMRLHVGNCSYLLLRTIGELEKRLNPAEFIRLHRSAIARRNFIAGFKCSAGGAWCVHLRNGRWQRVGRTYLAKVRTIAGR